MFNPVRSRFSLAVGALLVMTALPAAAGPSIEDSLALSMSKGIRDRMFWNLSVVSTKTKTKSEQPRDMTPEIVRISDLTAMRNQKAEELYERLIVANPQFTVGRQEGGNLVYETVNASDPRAKEKFLQALNGSVGLNNTNSAVFSTASASASVTATRIQTSEDRRNIITIRDALQNEQDLIELSKVRVYGTPTAAGLTAVNLLDRALSSPLVPADPTDPDSPVGYGFASGEGYLTTPQGIRAKSGNPSETLALSVGYFLNDDQNWAVEALVLGAPLRATVYGAGTNDRGDPNQLVGQSIINTKMLPPMAKFGYYFGSKNWVVRPYVGIAAMYAIFFDTKTTSYFDEYQGGKTSISLKNAFGVGPFIGLQSDVAKSGWQVGVSIGKIKIKTEATLVTRGTMFKTGDLALMDYKQSTKDAIDQAESLLTTANNNAKNANAERTTPFASTTYNIAPGGMTTELMKDLAAYKQVAQGGDGTLGTFVRKQRSTLDNTIFMLSVGKSF